MRTYSLLCVLLALSMLLIPAAAVREEAGGAAAAEDGGTVKVFSSGTVTAVDTDEYIKGVIAAEISPRSHIEAIKAQAVAAYTYALYVKNMSGTGGKPGGADITSSPSVHQGYYDKSARKKLWGDEFEQNEKKVEQAAAAVKGRVLTFNGEPILAAYFELCRGRTQSAESLWGSPYPYLVSVQSAGDKLSPAYSSTVTLSADEFAAKAAELTGGEPEGKPLLGEVSENDEGYVESVEIGGKSFTGAEVRDAFSLKSNAFTLTEKDGVYSFEVLGSGHGVGMSQYGADYMARQGSSYEEILFHYYPGTMLETM